MATFVSGLSKQTTSALSLFTSILLALVLALVVPDVPTITIYTGVAAIIAASAIGFIHLLLGLRTCEPPERDHYISEKAPLVMSWIAWIGVIHSLIMVLGLKLLKTVAQHPELSFSIVTIVLSFAVAYYAIRPQPLSSAPAIREVIEFSDERDDRNEKAFAISLRDKKRLYVYQAARLMIYAAVRNIAGSSAIAQLDEKRRSAEIRHAEPLLADTEYLKWKLHLLAAGSAAESLFLKTTSIQAIDDLNDFQSVGTTFLQLNGRLVKSESHNEREALLCQVHLDRLLKTVWGETREFLVHNQDAFNAVFKFVKTNSALSVSQLEPTLKGLELLSIPTVMLPGQESIPVSPTQNNKVVQLNK